MTVRLLLDEHYSDAIAATLRDAGHDVQTVVADPALRSSSDSDVFQFATREGRRIVTENIRDFRPLLLQAVESGGAIAALLLVPPRRFPRGRGDQDAAIATALRGWLDRPDVDRRPIEDWLT